VRKKADRLPKQRITNHHWQSAYPRSPNVE
jgi:hypothetical protein